MIKTFKKISWKKNAISTDFVCPKISLVSNFICWRDPERRTIFSPNHELSKLSKRSISSELINEWMSDEENLIRHLNILTFDTLKHGKFSHSYLRKNWEKTNVRRNIKRCWVNVFMLWKTFIHVLVVLWRTFTRSLFTLIFHFLAPKKIQRTFPSHFHDVMIDVRSFTQFI